MLDLIFCTSSNVKRWEIAAWEDSKFCRRAVLNKHRKTWVAKLAHNLAISINLYPLTPRCCIQAYGSLWNPSKWIKQQQNSLTDIVQQQKCFVGCFFFSFQSGPHMLEEAHVIKWCNTNGRESFSSVYLHKYERSRGWDASKSKMFEGQVVQVSVNDCCV